MQSTNNTLDIAIDGDGFFVTSTFGAGPGGNAPTITQGAASINVTRMGNFSVDSLGRLVTSDNRFVMGMSNTMTGLRNSALTSSELSAQELTDNNNDMEVTASDYTWQNVININQLIQDAYNIHTDDNGYLYTYKIRTGAGTDDDPYVYEDPTPAQLEEMFKADDDNDGYYDVDGNRDGIITPAEEDARAAALATPLVGLERIACTITGEMVTVDANSAISVAYGTTPVQITSFDTFYNDVAYLLAFLEGTPAADITGAVADGGMGLAEPATGAPANTTEAQNMLRAYTTAAEDRGLRLGELTYKDLGTFNVDTNGVISTNYNNEARNLARIDLGIVDNPGGLDQAGNTSYTESGASGTIKIKAPNSQGTGKTVSKRLEMSNVNLATEFSDMIVTQRGYQANARIITTSDSMLEELVNLKR
jgi:flagellar hook protein FlgE